MMKDWKKFEYYLARTGKGVRHALSGAQEGNLDVSIGNFSIDAKLAPGNDPKSIRIKIEEWEKADRQASIHGQIPAMAFRFDNQGLDLLVLEWEDFVALEEERQELQQTIRKLKKLVKKLKGNR